MQPFWLWTVTRWSDPISVNKTELQSVHRSATIVANGVQLGALTTRRVRAEVAVAPKFLGEGPAAQAGGELNPGPVDEERRRDESSEDSAEFHYGEHDNQE